MSNQVITQTPLFLRISEQLYVDGIKDIEWKVEDEFPSDDLNAVAISSIKKALLFCNHVMECEMQIRKEESERLSKGTPEPDAEVDGTLLGHA